jgi:hypothetical protein
LDPLIQAQSLETELSHVAVHHGAILSYGGCHDGRAQKWSACLFFIVTDTSPYITTSNNKYIITFYDD